MLKQRFFGLICCHFLPAPVTPASENDDGPFSDGVFQLGFARLTLGPSPRESEVNMGYDKLCFI